MFTWITCTRNSFDKSFCGKVYTEVLHDKHDQICLAMCAKKEEQGLTCLLL